MSAGRRVLVVAASRHGSTDEVADQVARVLAHAGLAVERATPEHVERVEEYDALVLGSAVYFGRWLRPARDWVSRHETALGRVPLWLFSVGRIGDQAPPVTGPETAPIDEIVRRTGARDHRFFGGVLDRSRLVWWERLVVSCLGAPEGDYRDWDEIRAWAAGIAGSLRADPPLAEPVQEPAAAAH